MIALLLLACNENNVSKITYDAIALVKGDFDDINTPLVALDIGSVAFDGFIVQATYEPEDERTKRGEMGLAVEQLLTSTDANGRLDLERYNAVFIASGTRGLGAGQYNNVLLPDDSLLQDPALDNLCTFVEGGGTLVVSDWAYEVVEHCWPDAIAFFGDAETLVPDAAQKGIADDALEVFTQTEALTESLGASLALRFDYSAWAVIEGVGADTEVLLTGDGAFQPAADQAIEDLTDVPMLVRFSAGNGQVVYSAFHWSSQAPVVAQNLLLAAVDGLAPGSGSESAEVVP